MQEETKEIYVNLDTGRERTERPQPNTTYIVWLTEERKREHLRYVFFTYMKKKYQCAIVNANIGLQRELLKRKWEPSE